VLDDALGRLGEVERNAILLRYFEDRAVPEVALALGLKEPATRKRLVRALEKLRNLFAKRGITVSAGALTATITANAVQAAPAVLAATVSTAALAGVALQASGLFALTRTIAMTTLQKTTIATTLALAAGTGIYALRQGSQLSEQLRTFQQQQAPLVAQVQQLEQERSHLTNQLAALREENTRLQSIQSARELLKLRGQVGVLRQSLSSAAAAELASTGAGKLMNDPTLRDDLRQSLQREYRTLYDPLIKRLNLSAEDAEKLAQIMSEASIKAGGTILAMTQTNAPVAELRKTILDAMAEMDNQLKPMLGEAGYSQYKTYCRQLPAQETVSALNKELGGKALDAEQCARLAQILNAEPYDVTHGSSGELDAAFFGSQQDIGKHLEQVAESNQRLLNQAASFLGPEQLAALARVQGNSLAAERIQGKTLAQKD
jgi:hypothetical protein